ncbi:MAG: YeeE/YedE thiosulfate transporter family protein [Myxococcota bacterium]
MDASSALSAIAGGGLIGLSAALLLLTTGRIAGISGIYGGLLCARARDIGWRVAFVAGLAVAGVAFAVFVPDAIEPSSQRSTMATAIAGVLVGFGVRMGSGCTSGHGVCGVGRLSRRSLVATAVFLCTGMVTASVLQVLARGAV